MRVRRFLGVVLSWKCIVVVGIKRAVWVGGIYTEFGSVGLWSIRVEFIVF